MPSIQTHIEQINLSAQSIATLPFPAPKIFTNALLAPHDITALIRDTEPHERALFSVPPPPPPPSKPSFIDAKPSSRRQTVFNVSSGEVTAGSTASTRAPRRHTAVAAVLGGELHSQIRRTQASQNGELDVEVLLRGAEKLGTVYALPGAKEEISRLRVRHAQLSTSVDYYENKVEKQRTDLDKLNRSGQWDEDDEDDEDEDVPMEDMEEEITEEDLLREEEEVRKLERKKRELEERLTGMNQDIGGLSR